MKSFNEFLAEDFKPGHVDTKLKIYSDDPIATYDWKCKLQMSMSDFKGEAGFDISDRKKFIALQSQLFNTKQIYMKADSSLKNIMFFSDKFSDKEKMHSVIEDHLDAQV